MERNNLTLLERTKIQLVIHAYSICETQKQVANYIGISDRTLRDWINRYEELKIYHKFPEENKPSGPIPEWSKYD